MSETQLTLPLAKKPEGVLILGSLAIKQLEAKGIACFMINLQGVIELVPPVELAMDYLPEQQALLILVKQHKYTDDQLHSYLRARDARRITNG